MNDDALYKSWCYAAMYGASSTKRMQLIDSLRIKFN